MWVQRVNHVENQGSVVVCLGLELLVGISVHQCDWKDLRIYLSRDVFVVMSRSGVSY